MIVVLRDFLCVQWGLFVIVPCKALPMCFEIRLKKQHRNALKYPLINVSCKTTNIINIQI